MIKLFRYELRRTLGNRLFFMILLVCLVFGWLILTTETIRGVAHTAPFSPWSFGDYLCRLLPLLCLGELCLLSIFTSRREQGIRPVTQATQVHPRQYALIRVGAVLTGTLLLDLCVIVLAVGFYVSLFGWLDYGKLVLPALLTLLPAAVFCLGTGWALGRRSSTLVYVLMGAVVLLCLLPLPQGMAFSLIRFFTQYPLTLDCLDPEFSVPGDLAWGRILWLVVGVALFLYGIFSREGRSKAGISEKC